LKEKPVSALEGVKRFSDEDKARANKTP